MLLDADKDRNIDMIGKKVSIFCGTYIAVGYRIQGGSPGRLRLRYAVVDQCRLSVRLCLSIPLKLHLQLSLSTTLIPLYFKIVSVELSKFKILVTAGRLRRNDLRYNSYSF